MKNKIILFVLLNFSFLGFGQIPSGYYDDATGTGYTLKTQLYNIINGHTERTYANLWTDFQSTDKKVNGKVWDMYSDKPGTTPAYEFTYVSDQCGTYSIEGDCYNREHSFPKSWFAEGTPMYSELFHLYPTDGKVNGQRNNYPFGEVGAASWTSTNGSKLGTCNYPGYTGTVFEPIDEYKGDFARTYFYMATRYENIIAGWENNDSNGDAVLNGTSDQVYEEWYLNLIIDWHNGDPVSQKEIDRNNAVYAIQHNRNPFIDHPEYVAQIWGGETLNNPPAISNIITSPLSPKPEDLVNVSASITDSDGMITNAILRWSLVPGSLTNTINLSNTSGNNYSTVSAIPAQADGTTVYYKLEATDDSSDVTITNEHYYTVSNAASDIIILNENFTTCPPSGWITYSVASNKDWTCGDGYESINAYSGDVASNDWLISPAIDLNMYENEILTFKSWTKYTDTGNHPAVKLKYSTNYSGAGNPTSATWTEISVTLPAENSIVWTNSGNIDLSAIAESQVYIAFQYTSTGIGASSSTQWQIDSVLIVGDENLTNQNPVISNVISNPANPDENQSVSVSATISDSDGTISSAKILWGLVSNTYPNEITMTENTGTYSGIIPGQVGGAVVYFKISATDNEDSNTLSSQYSYSVNTIENENPVISGLIFSPEIPTSSETVSVSANITDTDGTISSAKIKWGTSAGVYGNTISMSASVNTYSGIIPAQANTTHIYFIVEANDNSGGSASSSEKNYIVTNPVNQAPEISDVQFSPSNPTDLDSVLVSSTVTDPDGTLNSVFLKWKLDAEPTIYERVMEYTENEYKAYIPIQEAGKTIYFMIVATDNNSAETKYMNGMYNVNTSSSTVSSFELNQIEIYPNPVKDNLILFFPDEYKNVTVTIYNMIGIVVRSESFNQVKGEIKFDKIDNLEGMYLVQIKTNDKQVIRKIIINNR